jgi:hypothetical protein
MYLLGVRPIFLIRVAWKVLMGPKPAFLHVLEHIFKICALLKSLCRLSPIFRPLCYAPRELKFVFKSSHKTMVFQDQKDLKIVSPACAKKLKFQMKFMQSLLNNK